MINYQIVLKVTSLLIVIIALFIFACLPVSLLTGGDDFISLAISAFITAAIGGTIWMLTGKFNSNAIGKKEAYLIVVVTWLSMVFFGSLPYLISGTIPNLTDAFFESMSGFTTTGASILTDIEAVSEGILFWRSLTHWIGGMGIIVFSVAILSLFGIGGIQLFLAEVPGPSKEKLHPRIKQTALRLWGIYVLLTLMQTLLLVAGNMTLYDAVTHSFSTISTGGFSTRNASMGAFSAYAQYVTIVFMILSGTNFTLHYLLLNRRWKQVIADEELRMYLGIIIISTLVIALFLVHNGYGTTEKSFRDALFQVTTIMTCTGFATADFMQWPVFCWFLLFLLMLVGGCAGSTAGGIKVIRHLLLLKGLRNEFRGLMHPSAYLPLQYNGHTVGENIHRNILAIFILYLLTFTIGSFLLTLSGLDHITAMGSVAQAMGNIGVGLAATGPASNFAEISVAAKWTLSCLMLIGRLEILTVFVLFSKAFYKK